MYIGKIYNTDLQSIDNFHDVHIRKRPIYLTKKSSDLQQCKPDETKRYCI